MTGVKASGRRTGRPASTQLDLERTGALDLLRKVLEPYNRVDYPYFEQLIVESCSNAKRYYDNGPDEFARRRDQHRKLKAQAPAKLRQIAKLKEFARLHPMLGDAEQRNLIESLENYQNKLAAELLVSGRGPLTHRSQVGPLLYNRPIDARKGNLPDAAEVGLIFELCLLFRRFTAKNKKGLFLAADYTAGSVLNGTPMPDYGEPHFELVSKLVASTFGARPKATKTIKKRIGRLLTENGGVTLVKWPQEKVINSTN